MYPHSVYLDRIRAGHTSWPVSPLVDGIPDIENITMALKTGPYGKCVYESDNDVADNQVSFLITFSSIIRIMIRSPGRQHGILLRSNVFVHDGRFYNTHL